MKVWLIGKDLLHVFESAAGQLYVTHGAKSVRNFKIQNLAKFGGGSTSSWFQWISEFSFSHTFMTNSRIWGKKNEKKASLWTCTILAKLWGSIGLWFWVTFGHFFCFVRLLVTHKSLFLSQKTKKEVLLIRGFVKKTQKRRLFAIFNTSCNCKNEFPAKVWNNNVTFTTEDLMNDNVFAKFRVLVQ